MAIKIEIQKTTEEFEIGSLVYVVDFSDEKIKNYNAYINKVVAKIDKTDGVTASSDAGKLFEETQAELRGFSDIFFGENSFDDIHKECGGSSVAMGLVMAQVIQEAQEQMAIFKEKDRVKKKNDHYLKKNNKK